MSKGQKKWEEFLKAKGWEVGVDQDNKFFLHNENEDCEFDDEDLYWGYTPIVSGYDCEKDIARDYGFNI